jgi:multisubunit Na+/H+ antiporter MnhG subunit
MVAASWAQIAAVFALLVISTPMLGGYLAKAYRNENAPDQQRNECHVQHADLRRLGL